jgi:hypothetical protein
MEADAPAARFVGLASVGRSRRGLWPHLLQNILIVDSVAVGAPFVRDAT